MGLLYLYLILSPSKYQFVVVCIMCAVCTQTSVSICVIPRDLVKMDCVKGVVPGDVVPHQVSVSSYLGKQ
jgi:hypothetical protein